MTYYSTPYESAHGHLKNRIKQALYLRGSTDFATIAEYQALIEQAVAALNRQCQTKFELEKPALQPLPQVRVSRVNYPDKTL